MCLTERILVTQCPWAGWTLGAFLSKLVRAAKGQSVTGSDLRMRCCKRLRNRLTGRPRLLKTLPKREESFKGLDVFLVLSLALVTHQSSFFSPNTYSDTAAQGVCQYDFRYLCSLYPPNLKSIYLTAWRHFFVKWHEVRDSCGTESWVSSLLSFNECDQKL